MSAKRTVQLLHCVAAVLLAACLGCPNGSTDGSDVVPVPGPSAADTDGDGVLDDGDGSGVPNDDRCSGGETVACDDNCRTVVNANQADADNDTRGNACDNCTLTANADQADTDLDGFGDACDFVDSDADGIRNDGNESGVAGDAPCNTGQSDDVP